MWIEAEIQQQGQHVGPVAAPSGGRTRWAHFAFTRVNIAPTILPKKIEDLREACVYACSNL